MVIITISFQTNKENKSGFTSKMSVKNHLPGLTDFEHRDKTMDLHLKYPLKRV